MKQQNAVKTFAILTIFLLAVFGTFLMAKPVQASESGQVTVTGERYYSKAWRILELVNQERAKAGLPALVMDRDLLDAAMQRAFEISVNFSHTRPNGEEFQSAFEASRWAMGENIAAGNTSPEAAMEAWMNSDGHRSNILDRDFVCIGVGAVNVNGKYYWVQCFGGTLKETASRNNYQDGRASAHISFDQTLASVRLCVNKNVLYLGAQRKHLCASKMCWARCRLPMIRSSSRVPTRLSAPWTPAAISGEWVSAQRRSTWSLRPTAVFWLPQM